MKIEGHIVDYTYEPVPPLFLHLELLANVDVEVWKVFFYDAYA